MVARGSKCPTPDYGVTQKYININDIVQIDYSKYPPAIVYRAYNQIQTSNGDTNDNVVLKNGYAAKSDIYKLLRDQED